MGPSLSVLDCEGNNKTLLNYTHQLNGFFFWLYFSLRFCVVECNSHWTTPRTQAAYAQAEQLAGRHTGLAGHRLICAGEY